MPRSGGTYSAPSGTLATTATPISSSAYNAFVNDLVADANAARPIVAGGTGATTASAALVNLGLTATAAELNALDGVTAAGTSMITAASVAAQRTLLGFAQSLATSGYVQLPGGVIIQWITTGSAGSGANGVVTFPTAFPSACTAVALQYVNTGSDEAVGSNWVAQVRAISAASFTIRNLGPASGTFYAIAVGY